MFSLNIEFVAPPPHLSTAHRPPSPFLNKQGPSPCINQKDIIFPSPAHEKNEFPLSQMMYFYSGFSRSFSVLGLCWYRISLLSPW